ncbi:MAG TPA: hypothetical protein VH914_19500 [Acidimicrobiia bacterium]|nr:hypothetical protein [Acidimicrobiia bacterium]
MANNPDPSLQLTSIAGVTRTLDDWATVFNLAIVLLPPRPEAAAWVPVIDRIYATFGDSDVRTTVCVSANESIARRILGDAADRWLTFCDPDGALASSLALERLPAFVHLRQDTSLVNVAQGWSPSEWQRVADALAKKEHWTSPQIAAAGNPRPTPGWALSA